MPLPRYTLTPSGQPAREVAYRDPGTNPKDLVVWLHGGHGSGEHILNSPTEHKVDGADNRIDLGPDGLVVPLVGDPTEAWFSPGENSIDGVPLPTGCTDDLYDVRFFEALVADIATRFPSVERIWFFGFSSGAKGVWVISGYNNQTAYPNLASSRIRGYFHGSHGVPVSLSWSGLGGTAKPSAMWWGAIEPDPPSSGIKTFAASLSDLSARNGSIGGSLTTIKAGCCGAGKDLKRGEGVGGVQVSRFLRLNGGHEFTYCTGTGGCKEFQFAVNFFTSQGFGAA